MRAVPELSRAFATRLTPAATRTINTNVDPDQNGIQPLPAGNDAGTGTDAFTVKDYTLERNGARGPGFFSFDMRVGYGFTPSGRKRLEVSGDNAPRKVQLGVRLQF